MSTESEDQKSVESEDNLEKSEKTSSKLNFTFSNYLKEKHGRPIFGVQFNHLYNKEQPPLFAAVGSNQVTIYECEREGGRIKLLSAYIDADSDENFFTCAWSRQEDLSVLAVAGSRGIIRLISPCCNLPAKNLLGHGLSINELTFSPKDYNMLVSAGKVSTFPLSKRSLTYFHDLTLSFISPCWRHLQDLAQARNKDHTLRLWNIKTLTCIAIFGGVEGHRDELLSADIDISGKWLISCGMDHSFKLWHLEHSEVKAAIQRSYLHDPCNLKQKPFVTYCHHIADFTTRDIHNNYVDCVRWWGKLVLSKSCDNSIVCWKPGKSAILDDYCTKSNEGCNTIVLHRFEFSLCEIWYMRFALDFHGKLLAVGNQAGKIFLWSLDHPTHCKTLSHSGCTSAVRQVSMNKDASILVGVCDDGSIWRWDINSGSGV